MVFFAKAISKLPYPVLYFLSDVLYTILFRLIGYRKDVIVTNLKKSFPEKSESEIKKITNTFSKYLCDLILEGIKTHSMSRKEINERLVVENPEVVNDWYDKGKSVVVVLGHYGNWEYGSLGFSTVSKHKLKVIYKPLTDKGFDKFMYESRTRFGAECVPMKETYKSIAEDKINGNLFCLGLVGDQAPSPHKGYWMEFLNQDTPVFVGCEKISRKYDYPIVFAEINRVKRGFYTLTFKNIHTNPASTENGEVTELHAKILEEAIKNKPDIWVWSHKRWKHKQMPDDLPAEQISVKYPPKQIKK